MHKRNVTLIALGWAAVVTVVILFWPVARHSDLVGWLHFPAIVLAVALSGGSHSPSPLAGWSGFLTYTCLYWLLFVVFYAAALEWYLLRRAFKDVDRMAAGLPASQSEPDVYLHHLGSALADLEIRRRHHWVLDDIGTVQRSDDSVALAATAIRVQSNHRVVKRLLRHFERSLSRKHGPQAAARAVERMVEYAAQRQRSEI